MGHWQSISLERLKRRASGPTVHVTCFSRKNGSQLDLVVVVVQFALPRTVFFFINVQCYGQLERTAVESKDGYTTNGAQNRSSLNRTLISIPYLNFQRVRFEFLIYRSSTHNKYKKHPPSPRCKLGSLMQFTHVNFPWDEIGVWGACQFGLEEEG